MFLGVFVCLFVCVHDYSRSKEQIFLSLYMDRVFGQRKKRLYFRKDPYHILDTTEIPNLRQRCAL